MKTEKFTCPECDCDFYLRGAKLRVFKQKKSKNDDLKGPFCCYRCSGAFNARYARLQQTGDALIAAIIGEI